MFSIEEEAVVSAFSIFIGRAHLKNGGCGWCPYHGLRYHKYCIALSHELKDPVAFSYGAWFSVHNVPISDSGKVGRDPNVGGTNNIIKSAEGDNENEGSGGGSVKNASALDQKITAASIRQE